MCEQDLQLLAGGVDVAVQDPNDCKQRGEWKIQFFEGGHKGDTEACSQWSYDVQWNFR